MHMERKTFCGAFCVLVFVSLRLCAVSVVIGLVSTFLASLVSAQTVQLCQYRAGPYSDLRLQGTSAEHGMLYVYISATEGTSIPVAVHEGEYEFIVTDLVTGVSQTLTETLVAGTNSVFRPSNSSSSFIGLTKITVASSAYDEAWLLRIVAAIALAFVVVHAFRSGIRDGGAK